MRSKEIVDVFEALETITEYTRRSFKELVSLKDAVGRRACRNIYAPFDFPKWRRSRMDGFACRTSVSDFTRPFVVKGDISAAGLYERELGPNECVRISTGSRVPDTADAVIRLEDSNEISGVLYLNYYGDTDNIEKSGSLIKSDQLLVKAGSKIDHRHIEILANLRVNNVYVRGFPRIGILSTGSEITDRFDAENYIVNSNYYALSSLLNIYGVPHSGLGVVEDDKEMLLRAVSAGIDNFDALISFGGTAFGKYDLMETVITKLGGDIIIDGLNSSPGKTFRFSTVRGRPFFVLPGTPQAAMICSETFITAWLAANLGKAPSPVETCVDFPISKRAGFYKLVPCLTTVENGRLVSRGRDNPESVSGAFRSVTVIPPSVEKSAPGEKYPSFFVYYM